MFCVCFCYGLIVVTRLFGVDLSFTDCGLIVLLFCLLLRCLGVYAVKKLLSTFGGVRFV